MHQLSKPLRASMPFLSLFSSVHVSDRVASLKEAEGRLFEFAKTRFAHPFGQEESNHHFELFDTPISAPSVIKDAASCQVNCNKDEPAADKNYSLHGVKVTNRRLSSLAEDPATTTAKQPAPLVLLHGYANGALYFYRNLMGLSHHFGSIYALDLLGWGLSSRPKFELIAGDDVSKEIDTDQPLSKEDKTILETKQKVNSAESFFVESLESWRKQHDLPKLTLAGHSMGGYLSVAYAERYPQHVERLILLSPVGVPEKRPEDERKIDHLPFYVRGMIKTMRYLFEKGVTPGAFLRSLPHSKSKQMVDGYITNRLPAITCPEEREHLGEYLYQNSMLPGSGECCLGEILTAGAFAKIPLVDRIPHLKTEEVHFIYGANDWMDYQGGLETQRLSHRKRTEWEEKQRQSNGSENANNNSPPPKIFVHGVKDASHLLMLDNYQEFNAAMIVAAGGEKSLPPHAPRPVELVCDEVARSGELHRQRGSVGEEGAKAFFRGPRWDRGREGEARELDDRFEEKKVEEQLA